MFVLTTKYPELCTRFSGSIKSEAFLALKLSLKKDFVENNSKQKQKELSFDEIKK